MGMTNAATKTRKTTKRHADSIDEMRDICAELSRAGLIYRTRRYRGRYVITVNPPPVKDSRGNIRHGAQW